MTEVIVEETLEGSGYNGFFLSQKTLCFLWQDIFYDGVAKDVSETGIAST